MAERYGRGGRGATDGRGEGRGRYIHYLACHRHMANDLASLRNRDGACWVFAGPDSP